MVHLGPTKTLEKDHPLMYVKKRVGAQVENLGTRRRAKLGEDVHYVSHGSANGEYTSTCRTAKVTETFDDPSLASLYVMNPSGSFYNQKLKRHESRELNEPGFEYRVATWHTASTCCFER